MNREEYLTGSEVSGFVDWFAEKLSDTDLRHGFVERRSGRRLQFSGLCDAFGQYRWGGANFAETCVMLEGMQRRLIDALKSHDDEALRNAAVEVVSWGGVRNGNEKWLKSDDTDLRRILQDTCALLSRGNDENLASITRFNAGMTKIYSLVVPDFIIYDSRVAAAIAWFVARWCSERQTDVDPLLQIGCLPAKESPKASRPKLRDPSTGGIRFSKINNNAAMFAQWNLRASWLLKHALDHSEGTCLHSQQDPLRALEAALFMWGYDLSESH